LSKKGIVISQQQCVLDVLKETGMSGCRLADTPIDPNQKLKDDKEGEQKLVGELIYLSNT
jgi:hypothetical protein